MFTDLQVVELLKKLADRCRPPQFDCRFEHIISSHTVRSDIDNEVLKISDKVRDRIIGAAKDAGNDFMFYSRKNDEELPDGLIEQAIESGVITVDEIVEAFREKVIGD